MIKNAIKLAGISALKKREGVLIKNLKKAKAIKSPKALKSTPKFWAGQLVSRQLYN
jgi:hypothetical protein